MGKFLLNDRELGGETLSPLPSDQSGTLREKIELNTQILSRHIHRRMAINNLYIATHTRTLSGYGVNDALFLGKLQAMQGDTKFSQLPLLHRCITPNLCKCIVFANLHFPVALPVPWLHLLSVPKSAITFFFWFIKLAAECADIWPSFLKVMVWSHGDLR